jgi:hypothetical protein
MKTFALSLLSLVAFGQTLLAECGLYEIPIKQRIELSEVVAEGRVIGQHAFWNPEHTLIYTLNIIEVSKIFKGQPVQQLRIITEGGALDGKFVHVTPSLSLQNGETGIFLAESSPVGDPMLKNMRCIGGPQGFLRFDPFDGTASAAYSHYADRNELFTELHAMLGNEIIIKTFPEKSNKNPAPPQINSFSPATVSAGTKSILSINGSGFGNTSGSLWFKNANDGGNTFISCHPTQILSWTDNQITAYVPSLAGTGQIRVATSGGAAVISTASLNVTWAEINLINNNTVYTPRLGNIAQGGYLFNYQNGFKSNIPAVTAFEKGLESWRCASFVKFEKSGQGSAATCEGIDGNSMIMFDNGSCKLPTGYLAQTFVYYSGCATGSDFYVSADEIDIKFASNPGSGWNFGPGGTSGGKYDLQSVAIHELGHAHQLDHIINLGKVMHFALPTNLDVRTLDAGTDISGGNSVMSRSIVSALPCVGGMQSLSVNSCGMNPNSVSSEIQNDDIVSFYPNPSSGLTNIEIPESFVGSSDVKIYNSLGQVVLELAIQERRASISLERGIYQYCVSHKNGQQVHKGRLVSLGQ